MAPDWNAENVLASLNRVIEPGWNVTLVDLGAVYGVEVDGVDITIEMTLPDPAMEARVAMADRVDAVLRRRHVGVGEIRIVWADDPPWREDFITEAGWLQRANPLPPPAPASPEMLRETLTHVIDPELGINIVDLGLVYDVSVGDAAARVVMTLTTPGCPLHASIEEAVERAIETRHPDLEGVAVELVWDPPWDTDRITPEGRAQLGWGHR